MDLLHCLFEVGFQFPDSILIGTDGGLGLYDVTLTLLSISLKNYIIKIPFLIPLVVIKECSIRQKDHIYIYNLA